MGNSDDLKWYIWRRHKDKPDEWFGWISDLKTGLAWIKRQEANGRTGFVVNNTPPTQPARQLSEQKVELPARKPRGDTFQPPAQVVPITAASGKRTKKEMAALKKTAAEELDRIRADEAADLEKED